MVFQRTIAFRNIACACPVSEAVITDVALFSRFETDHRGDNAFRNPDVSPHAGVTFCPLRVHADLVLGLNARCVESVLRPGDANVCSSRVMPRSGAVAAAERQLPHVLRPPREPQHCFICDCHLPKDRSLAADARLHLATNALWLNLG